MSESESKTDVDVEQKVAEETAAEGDVGTTDHEKSPDVEPPSELEQKIIKQVEVSNYDLDMYVSDHICLQ